MDFSKLDDWEKQIKAGNLITAQKEISHLRPNSIERRFALRLANIARRIGYHRFALRTLAPIVRPQKRLLKPATHEEILEYGISLVRLGVIPEALKLFASIDEKSYPDVLSHRASALIGQWDYHGAIPLLEDFVKAPLIDEYQHYIGKINLADAYLSLNNFKNAEKLAAEVNHWAKITNHNLLLGYTYQVQMQAKTLQGHYREALNLLAEVEVLLGPTHYRYSLYTKKWKAIIQGFIKPDKKFFELINAVKKEASQRHAWEVLRDCDLYLALLTKDEKLLRHLYFGSPSKFYRERIIHLYPEKFDIPKQFDLKFGPKENFVYDVQSATLNGEALKIKRGQLLHNILVILSSDFYAPIRPENIFSLLFPDEFFNPESSIHRIHSSIARTKSWLKKQRVPLEITEENSLYQIRPLDKNLVLKVEAFVGLINPLGLFLDDLKKSFGLGEFTSDEASGHLSTSKSNVKRFLLEAQEQNLIQKLKNGRNITYKILCQTK